MAHSCEQCVQHLLKNTPFFGCLTILCTAVDFVQTWRMREEYILCTSFEHTTKSSSREVFALYSLSVSPFLRSLRFFLF